MSPEFVDLARLLAMFVSGIVVGWAAVCSVQRHQRQALRRDKLKAPCKHGGHFAAEGDPIFFRGGSCPPGVYCKDCGAPVWTVEDRHA